MQIISCFNNRHCYQFRRDGVMKYIKQIKHHLFLRLHNGAGYVFISALCLIYMNGLLRTARAHLLGCQTFSKVHATLLLSFSLYFCLFVTVVSITRHSANSFYHSSQNLLTFRALSRYPKIKIQNLSIYLLVFTCAKLDLSFYPSTGQICKL